MRAGAWHIAAPSFAMTHDAISEHDGSTRRATSWLRRATTGPQPTTASLEAAPQVRRAPSSGVRPRARQDARHKNAEDVRALLGESTMRRILPSTGSGPPSPVLLRRAATASAHATRNPPTWFLRSSQTAQQPTKPHRVLSDIRDDDETDDSDTESVIMHDDPHRRLLPLVDETPALNAVASLLRLAGVPFSRRGDKITKYDLYPRWCWAFAYRFWVEFAITLGAVVTRDRWIRKNLPIDQGRNFSSGALSRRRGGCCFCRRAR